MPFSLAEQVLPRQNNHDIQIVNKFIDDQNLSFKLEDPFFLDRKAYKPLNFLLSHKKISLNLLVLKQHIHLYFLQG